MSSRFWPPLGFGAPKNEGKTTLSRCRPPVGLWASLALATGTAAFALLDARRVRLREMQVKNHLQVDTMRAEMQQASDREKELQSQLRSQAAEQIHKQRRVDACTDTVKDSKHSSANTIIAAWRRFHVWKLAQKAKHKELKQHLDSAGIPILTVYDTQTHCEKPTYDTRAPKFAWGVQHELPEVQESEGKEREDDMKEANIARMYAEHPEKIAHAKQMEKVAQLRDAASLHENSLKEKGISEEAIQAEIDNSKEGKEAARIQRWKLAKAERENTPYRYY